jgi:hypothetical protein
MDASLTTSSMVGSIIGAVAQDINTIIAAEVLIGIAAAFQISFYWVRLPDLRI